MAIFPDPALHDDEALIPIWLSMQLKENKITLMKGSFTLYNLLLPTSFFLLKKRVVTTQQSLLFF
jgi:hypothetical protein